MERSVEVIKYGFWPGVHFTDLDESARASSHLVHSAQSKSASDHQASATGSTFVEENLSPLPKDINWERFGAEERRVSSDGFLSFDGVLYGVPSMPPMAGAMVQVRKRHRELRIFYQGQLVATHQVRPRSAEIVLHPQQFAALSLTLFLLSRKRLEAQSKTPAISLPLERQTPHQGSDIGAAPQDVEQVEPTEAKDAFVAPIMAIIALSSAMVKTGSGQMGDPPHRQK